MIGDRRAAETAVIEYLRGQTKPVHVYAEDLGMDPYVLGATLSRLRHRGVVRRIDSYCSNQHRRRWRLV